MIFRVRLKAKREENPLDYSVAESYLKKSDGWIELNHHLPPLPVYCSVSVTCHMAPLATLWQQ